MRRFLPLVLVSCLAVAACTQTAPETQVKSEGSGAASANAPSDVADLGDFVVGDPLRIRNLAVFPISSKTLRDADRFITLEEGLQSGKVEIFEVGAQPRSRNPSPGGNDSEGSEAADSGTQVSRTDGESAGDEDAIFQNVGGDVNRLMVVNRADKSLYLMPGEVIVGGYQDRTIAQETILAATGKPVPVDVYCVEHGRWAGRGHLESVEIVGALQDASDEDGDEKVEQAAFEARTGKFVVTAGTLSKGSRLAAQAGEGQGAVWDKVAQANAASGVQPDSGAFTANFCSDDVLKRLGPYLDSLNKPVAARERIIGVAVAINGKLEAVDVFESTPLFQKVWPRLLKGYALDAMQVAEAKDADTSCGVADATAFIEKVRQSQVDETRESAGLVVTRRNSKEVMGFSARTEAADAAPPAMMGGFGGSVHAAGFSK
jgi:hypothetical protein